MKGCPFCKLELIKQQRVVLENEHCRFLQMPQEILAGSGVIVPKEHRETLFDLTKEEWDATYDLLGQVKEILDSDCAPDGYTVGWNCYPVGGQSIMHAHLHILPRFKDEPFAGKGIRHWLKSPDNMRKG
ncbi:HIT family protein [Mangrovibacillus cuniculi]|uniref:HIT domain-containing protein n=1 Tax=Mangrovibacillus cuniculi TaxID=2593652 RepID=A0A7S8CE57_9BACI|nr:HIT domain-containing protein [Mangrovibacillus cuniculi]QPC48332.1 HIT domain-containing protein [Mangrovibacillus cuniculi]